MLIKAHVTAQSTGAKSMVLHYLKMERFLALSFQ